MAKKVSEATKEFIAKAESSLQRPLSVEERKVVLLFDEQVVQSATESLSNEEIAGMVGDTGAVKLFEQLASRCGSLSPTRKMLLGFLDAKARKIVAALDLASELDQFSKWFLSLLRSDPLPPQIRALNFGLFEGDGGCRLYVTGAKVYDEEDSRWASAQDWCPQGRYAPLKALSQVYIGLRDVGTSWIVAQAIAVLLIKAFFEEHAAEVQSVVGKRKLFIASGFDDGDLYALQTPVSP